MNTLATRLSFLGVWPKLVERTTTGIDANRDSPTFNVRLFHFIVSARDNI